VHSISRSWADVLIFLRPGTWPDAISRKSRDNCEGDAGSKKTSVREESMLIGFFDIKGIVHRPDNRGVLRQLRENVRRLRPELGRQKIRLLRHDNAPSHASFFTREFLTKSNVTFIPHPFHQLKIKPEGRHFEKIYVAGRLQAVLNALTEHDFQDGCRKWQKRWGGGTSRAMVASRPKVGFLRVPKIVDGSLNHSTGRQLAGCTHPAEGVAKFGRRPMSQC
jgi:hypothetical protein